MILHKRFLYSVLKNSTTYRMNSYPSLKNPRCKKNMGAFNIELLSFDFRNSIIGNPLLYFTARYGVANELRLVPRFPSVRPTPMVATNADLLPQPRFARLVAERHAPQFCCPLLRWNPVMGGTAAGSHHVPSSCDLLQISKSLPRFEIFTGLCQVKSSRF